MSTELTGIGKIVLVTGLDTDAAKAVALAGIAPGATPGAAITAGTATYSGAYAFLVIDEVAVSDIFISGVRGGASGLIGLSADFDAGSLTGSTSTLAVNGVVSGNEISGSVTANLDDPSVIGLNPGGGSLDGTLDGVIGSDGLLAVFHGSDANTVMTGTVGGIRD